MKIYWFGNYKLKDEKLRGVIYCDTSFGIFEGLPKRAEKFVPELMEENERLYFKIDDCKYSFEYVAQGISLLEHLALGDYEFYRVRALDKKTGEIGYLLVVHKDGFSLIVAPIIGDH